MSDTMDLIKIAKWNIIHNWGKCLTSMIKIYYHRKFYRHSGAMQSTFYFLCLSNIV